MFFEQHIQESVDSEGELRAASSAEYDAEDASQEQLNFAALPFIRSSKHAAAGEGGASQTRLVQRLIEHTENERHCPEILPYPRALLDDVMVRIVQQRAQISRFAAEEQEAAASEERVALLPFHRSDILALELQRVLFFLHELLRCRLRKIESLAQLLYYEGVLERGDHGTEEYAAVALPQRLNLSANERVVADRLAMASQVAVLQAGLQAAPDDLHYLTPHPPHAERADILPQPNLHSYVFGVALEDLGVVRLDEGAEQAIHSGEMFLLPYRTFRSHVTTGQVRLL